MGNEEIGQAQLSLQVLEQVNDARLDGYVQSGDGLIEHEHRRARGQGAGQTDALALAAGEVAREAVQLRRVEAD